MMPKLSINALRHRRKNDAQPPSRITNETVAEHREQILAGGRKFKYPVQYAKHRLVINTIIITTASLLVLAFVAWLELYPMQDTSLIIYRVTRVVPVPVATVSGEPVLYSDYLVDYRGTRYYEEKYGDIKLNTVDGKRKLDLRKRQSIDNAERTAYARMLARAQRITISESDVDGAIDRQRNTANGRVSQETYDASVQMLYDQSPSDYRLLIKNSILRSRAAFAVDVGAKAQVEQAKKLNVGNGGDFAKTAEAMASSVGGKIVAGQASTIANTGSYNGLSMQDVTPLQKGVVSDAIRSTTIEGYYFVKVIDKTDTHISFSYLFIPLTKFTSDFSKLQANGSIHEYIQIPKQ